MTASRVVELRCDAASCGLLYRSGRLTVQAARHDASALGWQSEAGGDVCPDHAAARRYRLGDLEVVVLREGATAEEVVAAKAEAVRQLAAAAKADAVAGCVHYEPEARR